MAAVPADLCISSRWMAPMTVRDEVLEDHTLVVRDGRILDLLPSAVAAERYAAAVRVERAGHLVLPGLVDAQAQIAPAAGRALSPEHVHEGALLCIAGMLRAGVTCTVCRGYFPHESARTAAEQGLRAVIGIPIAETPSPWANTASDYLTRALAFRDEYRGHPCIATAFALHAPSAMSDSTCGRVATLADELDAGILIALHASPDEVGESLARHGLRPIERLQALGLLTPALTAAHMVHVDASDIALAQRSGIAVILCPEANLKEGVGLPPVASWALTGLRLGLGSGAAASGSRRDPWNDLRLLALASGLSHPVSRTSTPGGALSAWDALAIATRGGAAALGLDTDIGTLEIGKSADVCCVDLRGPATHPVHDPLTQLVFDGSRDLVSDVWISGRHLLSEGAFTRFDWPRLAARLSAWPIHPTVGG